MARSGARCADPTRPAHLVDPTAGDALAHLCRAGRVRHRDQRHRAARIIGDAQTEHASLCLDRRGGHLVVLLLTAGIRAAPSVLIVPLEDEFHWSRSTISLAVGVNLLLYGLIGPFAAALIDRLGVRRTMTAALAVTTAGVALTPVMHQPWQLIVLWGVIVGAGCGIIGNFLA